ncbi:hypothetical protein JCM15457_836 [Liquorilactobacillus sucicola DSM 21376 = JCM 15457]|uniref:Monooxygenase n=1 Tax=Liquorilactobacillus sucicola DSM 21376 = JCM 15457 TaxID=1423806 RepID=A0A023CVL1_9LACO|nr:hypothetical protein [Liquorilactobacillus sucicola]KRN06009.1 hypothetical protein FD15_GL001195 [Liquorilactobacillus sucicola DSM 21376 = JCM 15457]GAJ25933.1 hypothetical protein JCM15457_836 [Liquorilactobacillus sucicola DSM 21376 = JCM 15457]
MKTLHLTFGTNAVISQLRKKNKNLKLIQLYPVSKDESDILLALSAGETPFHGGISFKILSGTFLKKANYYFVFSYLTLNSDEQKIFVPLFEHSNNSNFILARSLNHNFNYLLLSAWPSQNAFLAWSNAGPLLFNQKYLKDSKYQAHTAVYQSKTNSF